MKSQKETNTHPKTTKTKETTRFFVLMNSSLNSQMHLLLRCSKAQGTKRQWPLFHPLPRLKMLNFEDLRVFSGQIQKLSSVVVRKTIFEHRKGVVFFLQNH